MKALLAVGTTALLALGTTAQTHVGRVLSAYAKATADSAELVAQSRSDPPGYQNASASKPAQPATPPGRVAVGGVLYKKVGCYQCHSNEAQGGLSGPRIGPNLFPFARFSQYIRNPTGEMPPYTPKVLSEQDIADIYAWVQARPRPPAVSTLPQLAP